MNKQKRYEGPFRFVVGDYVFSKEKDGLRCAQIEARKDTLPGPAYKVDLQGFSVSKLRLELNLVSVEEATGSLWDEITSSFDLENISSHPPIKAGSFCEAVISSSTSYDPDDCEVLVWTAVDRLGINEGLCRQALDVYCDDRDERVLAHYRHPYADESKINELGVLIRLDYCKGVKCLSFEYSNSDRQRVANLSKFKRFENFKAAIAEINFLGSVGWYTNFLHPEAVGKLPLFSYQGQVGKFVSYQDIENRLL